jgi:hypothetical protein
VEELDIYRRGTCIVLCVSLTIESHSVGDCHWVASRGKSGQGYRATWTDAHLGPQGRPAERADQAPKHVILCTHLEAPGVFRPPRLPPSSPLTDIASSQILHSQHSVYMQRRLLLYHRVLRSGSSYPPG